MKPPKKVVKRLDLRSRKMQKKDNKKAPKPGEVKKGSATLILNRKRPRIKAAALERESVFIISHHPVVLPRVASLTATFHTQPILTLHRRLFCIEIW